MTSIIELIDDIKKMAENPNIDNVVQMLRDLGGAVKEAADLFTDNEDILALLGGVDKTLDGVADIIEASVKLQGAGE
jgi:hypothetical protein